MELLNWYNEQDNVVHKIEHKEMLATLIAAHLKERDDTIKQLAALISDLGYPRG